MQMYVGKRVEKTTILTNMCAILSIMAMLI